MEFKKIQLNGFKSFAEKTDFLIEKGLTGIVGPNGCGKSNIVESLRWVMGETSAKSMRGSGMEDVIFSGTSNKSSKNIAEVSISINNETKDGPIQYKNLNQVEIRRKIEKDKGSKFYINHKEVRAKDAQMFSSLFVYFIYLIASRIPPGRIESRGFIDWFSGFHFIVYLRPSSRS